MLSRWRSFMAAIRRPALLRREMEEEFAYHVNARARDLMEEGVAASEARRRAALEFGSFDRYAEEGRGARGTQVWDDARGDLNFAWRQLRTAPWTYGAAAVVMGISFALLITAFALIDGVVLKPLAVPGAERVVALWERGERAASGDLTRVAPPVFTRWRAQADAFEVVAAWSEESVVFAADVPARLVATAATPEMFALLGAAPAVGRYYTTAEDRVGASNVVVLAHAFWMGAFGGDTSVVGTAIRLDGEAYTVVGVAAERTQPFDGSTDMYVPLAPRLVGAEEVAGAKFLLAAGRLRAGVSAEAAQQQLERLSAGVVGNEGWRAAVVPMHEQLTAKARSGLLLLLLAGVLVMLIACANVAALLMSRMPVRTRELALRNALGASRGRIIRQLVTESLVLSVLACGAGLLLAMATLDAALAMGPLELPRRSEIALDLRVVLFGLATGTFVLIAIGIAPALMATQSGDGGLIRTPSPRASAGPGARRSMKALTACEVAFTVVLVGTAALLLQSFRTIMAVAPGFDPENVTTIDLRLAQHRFDSPESWNQFVAQLLPALAARTGSDRVAATHNLPVSGRNITSPLVVAGRPSIPGEPSPRAHAASVTPQFFATMGIRIVSGRVFNEQDVEARPPVAVISASLARGLFPGENAVGKQMRSMFGMPIFREVIGVVEDVHQTALTEPRAAVYYTPFMQDPKPSMTVLVRAPHNRDVIAQAAQDVIRAIDSEQPITRVATMDEMLANSVARQRFLLRLIGLVATVALLVALGGVYATMAASVASRRNEIGIRMALGARRQRIVAMVMTEGFRYVIAGVVAGIPLLLALRRFIENFLFGVSADDPATLFAVAAGVILAALLGALHPARVAARVDPAKTLRM